MARVFILLLAITCALAYQVPLYNNSKNVINGQYIAVFQPNMTEQKIGAHYASLISLLETAGDEGNNKIIAKYAIGNFIGYALKASDSVLSTLRTLTSEIEYIEADQIIRLSTCSQRSGAVWGLDRISEKAINLDGLFRFNSTAGSGVDAYIVDTGIYIEHDEFKGRATWGVNYADSTNTDCNGHGTHVAGTVGGLQYGVASNVRLIAVKVLDCEGSGSYSGVISGIQWVATQHTQKKGKSVANLSLGGPYSAAVNDAVKNAIAAGVVFVVAAGNDNKDACSYSPASEKTAITVGATTIGDNKGAQVDVRASFSNYGTCVTVFAPGQAITSAWIGSPSAIETISGTSMASPHVAGIAALYLGSGFTNNSPAAVKSYIQNRASKGLITLQCSASSCRNSPNLLAYAPCA